MANVAIIINSEHQQRASRSLAEQLSLPIVANETADDYQFILFYESDILKLIDRHDQTIGSICVDFNVGKPVYRQKHHGKGKLPISKACGIRHGDRPSIIDATAGLGQDAFVLAGLGCDVLCLEQHPVLAALLADGLARASNGEPFIREIANRMTLINAQAEGVLASRKAEVIYLDPMYPHKQNKKSAKVKKAMQLFRSFSGTSSDERQ